MRVSRFRFLSLLILAALLMAACAPAAAPTGGGSGLLARPPLLATPTPSLSGDLLGQPSAALPDTESQLHSVYLPPRDRIALAQRLRGVTFIPTPPAAPARVWQVGDTADFWVDDVDANQKFRVQATLRYVTDHVYVWVQSSRTVDEDALRRSADTFETHTYPIIHAVFGSEWSPGVDGDPRIHILHTAGMGNSVAAYFASDSEYPPEAVSTSNAHEMFFVNLDTMADDIGTAYYDGVLAHEFQHMVHWRADLNEDTWLNEGLSELAALLTGFDRSGFAREFLSTPDTQLNAWPENDPILPHYGASFLFITYLHERFGGEATRLLVADSANGMDSLRDMLQALNATDPLTGAPITVEDVFADWLVANLLNDPGAADGRYGYTLLDPALPTAAITETISVYPFTQTTSLPQYSAHYLHLTHVGQQRVRFDFQGADQVRLIPVDAHSGRYMWYSNRGDASDSTLTRTFDLSGVQTATLEYDLWYDIEYLWDYGYLMISTNDGETWDILETANTTTDNPHNTAYGPGYTGSTGSDRLGPVGWLHEQVDLSDYTGGRVLIRFEMITDEATNQPGMAIDDVRIPEIGYSEDFEKGPGGWDSAGWLYMDNVLRQRWIVQQVTRNADGVQVTRLLGPEDGVSGTWAFDVGGPAGDVYLVISPLAPVTTERAQYEYTLTAVE